MKTPKCVVVRDTSPVNISIVFLCNSRLIYILDELYGIKLFLLIGYSIKHWPYYVSIVSLILDIPSCIFYFFSSLLVISIFYLLAQHSQYHRYLLCNTIWLYDFWWHRSSILISHQFYVVIGMTCAPKLTLFLFRRDSEISQRWLIIQTKLYFKKNTVGETPTTNFVLIRTHSCGLIVGWLGCIFTSLTKWARLT
jgi:hypothetical protein